MPLDWIIRRGFSDIGSRSSRDVTGLITRAVDSTALHFDIRFDIGNERIRSK